MVVVPWNTAVQWTVNFYQNYILNLHIAKSKKHGARREKKAAFFACYLHLLKSSAKIIGPSGPIKLKSFCSSVQFHDFFLHFPPQVHNKTCFCQTSRLSSFGELPDVVLPKIAQNCQI